MTAATQLIDVIRILGSRRTADADCAAVEEPLEVRLHGRAFAVIMRTPGADRELAAGFLLSERVITAFDDLGTIAHCTDQPTDQTAQFANVVNVTLTDAAHAERAWVERRQTTTNSSCGLCGRRTIESLSTDVAPVTSAVAVDAATLAALPARLRGVQAVFDDTGGLHAAGLFDVSGRLLDFRGRRRQAQRGGQGHRATVAGRRAPARPVDSVRQRPNVIRDRAEGALRAHSDRCVRVCAVEPGDQLWRPTWG